MTYQEAREVKEPLHRLIHRSVRPGIDETGVRRFMKRPVAKRCFTKRERDLLVRFGFAQSKDRHLLATVKCAALNRFFDAIHGFEAAEARGREARWQAFCGGLE